MLSKIFPRLIVIVPVQPEIPPILGDQLSFSLSLLLILLDPLILINMNYELTHTPNKLPCQRLSQIMLDR